MSQYYNLLFAIIFLVLFIFLLRFIDSKWFRQNGHRYKLSWLYKWLDRLRFQNEVNNSYEVIKREHSEAVANTGANKDEKPFMYAPKASFEDYFYFNSETLNECWTEIERSEDAKFLREKHTEYKSLKIDFEKEIDGLGTIKKTYKEALKKQASYADRLQRFIETKVDIEKPELEKPKFERYMTDSIRKFLECLMGAGHLSKVNGGYRLINHPKPRQIARLIGYLYKTEELKISIMTKDKKKFVELSANYFGFTSKAEGHTNKYKMIYEFMGNEKIDHPFKKMFLEALECSKKK